MVSFSLEGTHISYFHRTKASFLILKLTQNHVVVLVGRIPSSILIWSVVPSVWNFCSDKDNSDNNLFWFLYQCFVSTHTHRVIQFSNLQLAQLSHLLFHLFQIKQLFVNHSFTQGLRFPNSCINNNKHFQTFHAFSLCWFFLVCLVGIS